MKSRWRHAAVLRLKSLDRRLGRLFGRRTVLIEARTPMNLIVLRPVWAALRRDPRVRVRFTGEEPGELAPVLAEAGAIGDLVPRARAAWCRFDLYVNADPWNAIALRRCGRCVTFFHGVAGKYDLDNPARLAIEFQRYDRIAFVNDDRRQRYLAAGVTGPDKAALIGFPKVDALVNREHDGLAVRHRLGLSPARPTLLYAPTFSTASSLHLYGEQLVTQLTRAGFNVIAKLHDRSLGHDARYTGGVDWRERFRDLASPDQFVLCEDHDSCPCMAAADALITDHSSIGFEYLLLDRPVVVIDAPELLAAARINPEKWQLLRSAADVVFGAEELVPAVQRALHAPDRKRATRRAIAERLFWKPGTATARALALVYDLLDLPVPATVPRATADAAEGTAA